MADVTVTRRPPVHLWIVGGLALLWFAFGAVMYVLTQFRVEAYMAQFTPEQIAFYDAYPVWATTAWAIGVWSAVLGAVALLLRSRFAAHLFGLSLVGLVLTTIYTTFISDAAEAMGTGPEYLIFSVIIWLSVIGAMVYSVAMTRRGVLR